LAWALLVVIIVIMILISIYPYRFKKIFLLIAALICLSSLPCFA